MSKVKNISLLKYQKQAITAALNCQTNKSNIKNILSCCYLIPWENHGYSKCCLLLSVGTFHRSGIKFLIENFVGTSIMNFIPDLNLKLYIRMVCRQIRLKIDVIAEKWELFRKKKTVLVKDFYQKGQNPVSKKVYKSKVVIHSSAIKC